MQERHDALRLRFDFESWSGYPTTTLGWRFHLVGTEFTGWKTHRIQVVEPVGEPRATLSVWRPIHGTGTLVAVNIYECDNEVAARRQLLHLLHELESPLLTRADGPGEIAFTAGSTAVFFARSNFVAFVRNIERIKTPVAELAAILDTVMSGNAGPHGDGDAPRFSKLALATGSVRTDHVLPIHVEATDPGGRPVWFQFSVESGELRIRDRQPHFIPNRPGAHAITVRAIGCGGLTTAILRAGDPLQATS